MQILVAEDDRDIASLIAHYMQKSGWQPHIASSGDDALAHARKQPVDVAILDVMLPGMSGLELSRRLKEHDPTIAVILLTARDAVDDRVRGLDSGADDYMVKPFEFAELAARIRAVRRRDALSTPSTISVAGLTIDLHRHRFHVGNREVALSRTEFDVLRVLAVDAGATVSRSKILDEVWGSISHIDSNIVDQYVSYLRRKLDQESAGARIVTVRGVGFSLHPSG